MRYMKRVGPTNGRFTRGKIYKYDGTVVNDTGGISNPSVHMRDYWVECDEYGNAHPPLASPVNPGPPIDTLNEFYNQTKEGETMITIEKPTLINGRNADGLAVGDIIEMIKQEEDRIENLKSVKSKSKAIDNLKEKHEQNIKDLIEILDERD